MAYIAPDSSKDFLDIQVITECRFILNAYVTTFIETRSRNLEKEIGP